MRLIIQTGINLPIDPFIGNSYLLLPIHPKYITRMILLKAWTPKKLRSFSFLIFWLSIPRDLKGTMPWSSEYSDYILCKVGKISMKKGSRYDTELHLIVRLQFWRVWSASSFSISPTFSLTQSCSTARVPFMGQIHVFESYAYLIEQWAKKKYKKKTHKQQHKNNKCVQWTWFPHL